MSNIIQIKNLCHSYGSKIIYENLSLDIKEGSVYGILGKNGVGKSTLINILMGYLSPKSGECLIFGEPSHKLTTKTKENIALLHEGFVAYDYMSIKQVEEFFAPFYKNWNKNVFYELVDLMKLNHNQKLSTLSFGQKSQVVLGAIFAQDAKLLILDDYSMGLDAGYRRLFIDYLKEYIATRSKDEIHKLVELDVTKVYKLVDGIEMEVDFDEITYEDILVIRSGEKIPVDGIIDSGNAEINEAIINGRSEPDFKEAGDEVYAGTICDKGRIYIKVTALGNETYISRTMREVEASLALKSPSEVEADKLASKLLKLGSVLTIGTFALTGSFINAFAVMIVMSCPCATVLAASTAISAGISNGAKNGILIKGGEALENVSKAEVFCFDKTGTLTTGKPIIVDIITANGISEDEILRYAAIAEFRNSHPIAKAIISHAKEKTIQIDQSGEGEIIPGFGVKTKNKNETILVGNRKLFTKNKISTKEYTEATKKHLHKGKTVVYVARDKEVLGFITFKHEVRPGTKQMIEELRNKGVKHIALLTGDELKVANSFALDFGFDSVFANQTPEGKADAIDELKKTYKKVVMVGDGVNDTYAMSKADVAISFAAAGSEAAIAVSDIAITHSHPEDITYLYDLSEKSLKVVNQNYWIGTGTNLIGVGFAGIGLLSPVAAGAIHIGHTIGIMANSSKLALSKNHNQVDTFEVL